MVQRIHHIDFVVRDLDAATERYRQILGIEPRPRESLESRGVDLVRFRLGDTWLILVQPVRSDSPVAGFLDEHGEGFFHIAYAVDDVAAEVDRLVGSGIRLTNRVPRRGVEGWRLADLDMADTFGVYSQLVEEDD